MLDNFFDFTHTEHVDTASLKDTVTWIDYKKGTRSLFTATAPIFKPILIEHCDIAHDKKLSDPVLSPSGQYLCYTRRKYTSDGYCEKTLVVRDLFNKTNPCISLPHGKQLCFNERLHQLLYIHDQTPNQLSCTSLLTGETTSLWKTEGKITALTLCQTTQQLALQCQKQTNSFIAIYHLDDNKAEWIAPGFDIDSHPIWSPSGQHLAFTRQYHSTDHWQDALPNSQLPAFSLMLFTCQNKNMTTLWDSRTCIITSQSSQEGHRPPCWLNNQELVFCHEGCGWEHAYRIDIATRHITPLSKGDFLVRDCVTCPSSETVYLCCNKHQRHHYHIDIVQNEAEYSDQQTKNLAQALDYSMGFSPQPIGSQGRYLALLNASNHQPCQLAIFDQHTNALIFPRKKTRPIAEKTPQYMLPSSHTLKALDGKICYGQMFRPPSSGGPYPAILYLHDGPGQQSLPGFQPSLEMSFHYTICQYLAHKGFVVFDLNYRGSGGYNKSFREAKDRSWQGASEYHDVQAAGKWLSRQPQVNSKQVGIMGKGWGGYLTALGLARDSQLFHAGVDVHGYHHLPRLIRTATPSLSESNELFTCIEAESATRNIACAKLAIEHSPWDRLDDWMSPVLLVHGDNNKQVPFSESQQLHHALNRQGVQVKSLVLPGETHTFTYHTSWKKLAHITYIFFKNDMLRRFK